METLKTIQTQKEGPIVQIACLDFEGVLVPEIWLNLAQSTGIEDLRLTTRDVESYDELMSHRLKTLSANGIGFSHLSNVAASLEPLPGAKEFLVWLRQHYQVALVSDTFYELCASLVGQLQFPMMLCHRLKLKGDTIVGYSLRQPDHKQQVVCAFQKMAFDVVATGDSYNDISMLRQSNKASLFRPSDKVRRDHPDLSVANNYKELKEFFSRSLSLE